MKKLNLFAILVVSVSLATFTTSCNSNEPDQASLTITAQDESQVSSISDDVVSSADDIIETVEAGNYAAAPSASAAQKVPTPHNIDGVIVTYDKTGNEFPKTITLDYGTTGLTGKRGNVFKGKIIIVITGRMTVSGSSRTYSFDNFSVNDNVVKGTKSVTFSGLVSGKPTWSIVVKDTVVRTDGKTVIWNAARTRTFDNNGTPLVKADDTFSFVGNASGVNAAGVSYTIETTKPLVMSVVWPVFIEGTTLLTTEKRTVVVDYGDGTKDLKATATVNGVTKEFTLRGVRN